MLQSHDTFWTLGRPCPWEVWNTSQSNWRASNPMRHSETKIKWHVPNCNWEDWNLVLAVSIQLGGVLDSRTSHLGGKSVFLDVWFRTCDLWQPKSSYAAWNWDEATAKFIDNKSWRISPLAWARIMKYDEHENVDVWNIWAAVPLTSGLYDHIWPYLKGLYPNLWRLLQ